MTASLTKSKSIRFKSWNSPYLLTNQFQLLAKIIETLNASVPPEENNVNAELPKELELKISNGFSHQMMPSWLALAKSYYFFYRRSVHDKALINTLEQKLNIKTSEYGSLSMLIEAVFFAKYPNVNSQYQPFINNIIRIMAKLTAVALSTPALINEAHHRDKKQFEEAGPSMSSCINPIETILRHMMSRAEVDKSFVISATSLLLQVKAIKSHYEQMTLIQQLENLQKDNKSLQKKLEKIKLGMQKNNNLTQNGKKSEEKQNTGLQPEQTKEEKLALVKVVKLQKIINQYYKHLTDALIKSPTDKKADVKRASIAIMSNTLGREHVLPGKRIELFATQLNEVAQQLSDHRDSLWIRFLRDCLRILAFTFFGVAIYRKLTGQSVNFFKPSHGQRFVDEVDNILTIHQDSPGNS